MFVNPAIPDKKGRVRHPLVWHGSFFALREEICLRNETLCFSDSQSFGHTNVPRVCLPGMLLQYIKGGNVYVKTGKNDTG